MLIEDIHFLFDNQADGKSSSRIYKIEVYASYYLGMCSDSYLLKSVTDSSVLQLGFCDI